jgi:hypothetical protein
MRVCRGRRWPGFALLPAQTAADLLAILDRVIRRVARRLANDRDRAGRRCVTGESGDQALTEEPAESGNRALEQEPHACVY